MQTTEKLKFSIKDYFFQSLQFEKTALYWICKILNQNMIGGFSK